MFFSLNKVREVETMADERRDNGAAGQNVGELDENQLARMKVAELKVELRQRHLRTTGRKRELLERLRAALLVERERVEDEENDDDEVEDIEDEEEEEDDNDDNDVEDEGNRDVHPPGRIPRNLNGIPRRNDNEDDDRGTPIIHRRRAVQRVLLTFKDVEGTLKKFSGDDHTDVQRWLRKFEEMAALCEWNDVQKVAYAKRLLEGSAELFVEYEDCLRSWAKLKKALKEEFEQKVDSLQVHRELTKRRKKAEETLQSYTYKMLQIASQANLEVRVVIQYIIEGIPDEAVNKSVLYGAQTIKQLKERFIQYESLKREAGKTKAKIVEKNDKVGKLDDGNKKKNNGARLTTKTGKRCYNCGSDAHVSLDCPDRGKGKKCFKCNNFGHISSECREKPKDVFVISRPKKEKYQR